MDSYSTAVNIIQASFSIFLSNLALIPFSNNENNNIVNILSMTPSFTLFYFFLIIISVLNLSSSLRSVIILSKLNILNIRNLTSIWTAPHIPYRFAHSSSLLIFTHDIYFQILQRHSWFLDVAPFSRFYHRPRPYSWRVRRDRPLSYKRVGQHTDSVVSLWRFVVFVWWAVRWSSNLWGIGISFKFWGDLCNSGIIIRDVCWLFLSRGWSLEI